MLNRIRKALDPTLTSIGRTAARTRISPTGWTVVALAFAVASGCLYTLGGWTNTAIAGVMLLVSGFFDMIDGTVARITNKVSEKGAFLDSTFDRLAEVAIFFGILFGETVPAISIFLATTFSLLVSYTRARGEALGVKVFGVGIGERAERLLVLAIFSICGQLYYGVVIVMVLALVTLIQRIIYIAKFLGS